jgi:hypothetical protein
MRMLHCFASIGLALLAGVSLAEGIKVDAGGGYWFGSETRLHLQAQPLATPSLRLGEAAAPSLPLRQPLAASVTGDYYFSSALLDGAQPRNGFRASGALLIRESGISLSDVAMASRSGVGLGRPARLSLGDAQAYSVSTLPYVGIGYSDVSLKNGWGWWADVGLVVQSPGNAVGLGRVLSGTQGVDELMRELRMAPMVQLGVNYSF